MEPLLTSAEMREVDSLTIQRKGIPQATLMQNAAQAIYGALVRRFGSLLNSTSGLIVAGPGNNGGDAKVLLKILIEKHSCPITLWDLSQDKPDFNFSTKVDWIIDGIFGSGLNKPVSGIFLQAIEKINLLGKSAWTIAIDIPSGLSGDTGQVMGSAVCASETIALGFLKRGLVTGIAADYVGRLSLDPIGIPRELPFSCQSYLYTKKEAQKDLPIRPKSSHKGNFGHVYLWAGVRETHGAILLSALGALRSGAGLTTILCDKQDHDVLLPRLALEVMVGPQDLSKIGNESVLVIGPGIGKEKDAKTAVSNALVSRSSLVLDADALNVLAEEKWETKRSPTTVLTPHPKEAARLLETTVEEIEKDRYKAIEKLVTKFQVGIVLKGKGTLCKIPGEPTLVVNEGDTGLSKGGSGDLLAGIVGSFIAQGVPLKAALPLAVYVHGNASVVASQRFGTERMTLASDLADCFSQVFRELE